MTQVHRVGPQISPLNDNGDRPVYNVFSFYYTLTYYICVQCPITQYAYGARHLYHLWYIPLDCLQPWSTYHVSTLKPLSIHTVIQLAWLQSDESWFDSRDSFSDFLIELTKISLKGVHHVSCNKYIYASIYGQTLNCNPNSKFQTWSWNESWSHRRDS